MRLLMSVYACAPEHGSEHAVGWNWTTGAHRQGHEVWAFASPAHRHSIEAACRRDRSLSGINWVFPEVKFWPLKPGQDAKWERSHNLLWQIAALRIARVLTKRMAFDAIHHLTWAGLRAPTFLGSLGVPLIIGPVGGGETSTLRLRKDLRLKGQVTEWVRDLSSATITLNPITRAGLSAASLIFVKTPETRRLLTAKMQAKSRPFTEVTISPDQIGQPIGIRPVQSKLMVVGRLLYWKGTHIAIEALRLLALRHPGARLTIVGRGPEQENLRAQADLAKLGENIDWVPWLPREELMALYERHDLLLFPSLHDSGGTVVLEALSRGLPVICLDLGGPRHIVCQDSGIVISTRGRDTSQVAEAMACEIHDLLQSPERLARFSAGAIRRAHQFAADEKIGSFYNQLAAFLKTAEWQENPPPRHEGGTAACKIPAVEAQL